LCGVIYRGTSLKKGRQTNRDIKIDTARDRERERARKRASEKKRETERRREVPGWGKTAGVRKTLWGVMFECERPASRLRGLANPDLSTRLGANKYYFLIHVRNAGQK